MRIKTIAVVGTIATAAAAYTFFEIHDPAIRLISMHAATGVLAVLLGLTYGDWL